MIPRFTVIRRFNLNSDPPFLLHITEELILLKFLFEDEFES